MDVLLVCAISLRVVVNSIGTLITDDAHFADELASASIDLSLSVAGTLTPYVPVAVLRGARHADTVVDSAKGLKSRVKENPRLVREAEVAGKSHQASIDKLTDQLNKGNLNPGIGTKPIGKGLSEARSRDGARVFFRATTNGIEILGKSNKANQQKVINEVLKTFGGG